jgi:hypothetical protein
MYAELGGSAHRLVWTCVNETPQGIMHIDGTRMRDAWCCLRVVSLQDGTVAGAATKKDS